MILPRQQLERWTLTDPTNPRRRISISAHCRTARLARQMAQPLSRHDLSRWHAHREPVR